MALIGLNVGLGKAIVALMPVMVLLCLRFLIAVAVLAPCYRPSRLRRISAADWRRLLVQSLFGTVLFTWLMLNGAARTTALAAGVITSALPAVAALLAWLLLGERPERRTMLAIVLAVSGVVIVNMARPAGDADHAAAALSTRALLGNLLVLGAVVCEAVYVVTSRRLSQSLPAIEICAMTHLLGLALSLPLCASALRHFDWRAAAPMLWPLVLWYSLSASVFSFWLWMKGVRHVAGARAGVFTSILPVAAAAYGIVFLRERPGIAHGIALAAVLGAIVLAADRQRLRNAVQ